MLFPARICSLIICRRSPSLGGPTWEGAQAEKGHGGRRGTRPAATHLGSWQPLTKPPLGLSTQLRGELRTASGWSDRLRVERRGMRARARDRDRGGVTAVVSVPQHWAGQYPEDVVEAAQPARRPHPVGDAGPSQARQGLRTLRDRRGRVLEGSQSPASIPRGLVSESSQASMAPASA